MADEVQLNIRVDPRIRDVLKIMATLEHRSQTDIISNLIQERAKELGLWPGYERILTDTSGRYTFKEPTE